MPTMVLTIYLLIKPNQSTFARKETEQKTCCFETINVFLNYLSSTVNLSNLKNLYTRLQSEF